VEFQEALPLLKQGKRMTRDCWPVGAYVTHVMGSPVYNVEGHPIRSLAHLSHFAPDKNGGGDWSPWCPTHADILAYDWTLVENANG